MGLIAGAAAAAAIGGGLSMAAASRHKNPNVPNLSRLDPRNEQINAINANLANMPSNQALVSQANLFSEKQIDDMLSRIGGGSMFRDAAGVIGSELHGEIPDDVSGAVQRSGAARALGGGYGGSGMNRNLVARDLGLTSLDLTQRGLASAESWMRTAAAMYQPSMMNLQSMFITPAQVMQLDAQQQEAQFQRDWMDAQIKALPDNTSRMLSAASSSFSGLSGSLMGGMGGLGGGMGGGGGNVAGTSGLGMNITWDSSIGEALAEF